MDASETTPSNTVSGSSDHVYSVLELTLEVKDLLEGALGNVWVTGEISNFSRPRSGHCYLSLKDDDAVLSAVIWRTTASRLRFDLSDGLEVLCQGAVDVYPPHGKYQLVIRQIQPRGMGPLELAFRQLREKLAAEGLFDAEKKQPLPRFPQTVAVVTSPTGAAIRDFLNVAGRRWRGVRVIVVPVRVQGDGAAEEIASAIRSVNRMKMAVDTLVVCRGGGSLEDLWSFNEECVVRAIHASAIPVVSGVGHEVDVTLSDLAADVRAPTPSAAAELVVPPADEMKKMVSVFGRRLLQNLRSQVATARLRLDAVAARRAFREPQARVHDLSRRLDELADRATRAARQRSQMSGSQLAAMAGRLESLSPLAVLRRGYTVTRRSADQEVIRDASLLSVGEAIVTRFHRGEAVSRVERIEAK